MGVQKHSFASRHLPRLLTTGLALLGMIVAGVFYFQPAPVQAAGGTTTYGRLNVLGDTTIVSGSGAKASGQDVRNETDHSPQVAVTTQGSGGPGLPPPPTQNPNPKGLSVTSKNAQFSGFNGISHFDQRNAGTGKYANTQPSLEPPDQGLCVGNGYVLESVNVGLAVYNQQGKMLAGVEPINQFYGLAPAHDRVNSVFGPFLSDPKCVFDPGTRRWFASILEIDADPATGALTNASHTYIAVSQTSDPTKSWTVFNFDTTDNGANGTPAHANCPCFGDQPLIGFDHYGFYVTTNEFPIAGPGFNGAQIYAISKHTLITASKNNNGGPVVFAHINAADYLAPFGGISYSVQPATSPSGAFNGEDANNQSRLHGIEYFLSALQFGAPPYQVLDNRIATWALTNTAALNTNSLTPDIALHVKVIGSETYGQPNSAQQKAGPTPLRDLLAAGQYPGIPATSNPLETIQTNDDRMNQVVFADDSLWSGVNTLIGDGTRTGIAYFRVHPSWTAHGDLQAEVANQGYVAINNASVYFPSIGVNGNGQGVMVFSMSGPTYYPSSAYVYIGTHGVSGKIHIAGAGFAPEDGFSGYAPFSAPPAARWGDYSAAVAAGDGSIWTASEYIPNSPRTVLANWGTFVSHIGVNGENN